MADSSRIEDLRRRVHKDPASIAFAQLAEECRRAGNLEEAVSVAKAGLALHPTYLSARVTLGRTLLELDQLDDARTELQQVLRSAPENLAALRALAETLRRLGDSASALTQYRAALALAKNDPDLQDAVAALEDEAAMPAVPEPVAAPAASFSYADADPVEIAPAAPAPSAFSYADPDPIDPTQSAPPAGAFSYADPEPAVDVAPPAPAPSAFSYANPEPTVDLAPAAPAPSAFSYAEPDPIELPPPAPTPSAFSYANPEPAVDLAPSAPAPSGFSYADPEPELLPESLPAVEPERPIADFSYDAAPDTSVPDPTLTLSPDFFSHQSSVDSPESPAASVESPVVIPDSPVVTFESAVAGLESPVGSLARPVDDGPDETECDVQTPHDPARDRAVRTLVVLEQWLQAVHVSRAERHP